MLVFRRETLLKGEIIDSLGEYSGKYNFQVKYTLPPWAFKNEVIVPDGWGGIDDNLIKQNEIPSCDEEDQFEKQNETIRQGER